MHLEIIGGKCVSSMKKCIFISLEKCFCTVFCEFFEFIFDCTCALANQSRNAGMLQLQKPSRPNSIEEYMAWLTKRLERSTYERRLIFIGSNPDGDFSIYFLFYV
jgi:hypothetical protein